MLDQKSWHPEPLSALMPDYGGSAMRLVQFRCRKDTIATDAATQPRCVRLLISERTGFHRPELGRKQLGVARVAISPQDLEPHLDVILNL